MDIDRMIMAFAGALILISLGLAYFFSLKFLFLTGLVGGNLFQASLTRFCPLALLLKRFGFKSKNLFK